MTYIGNNALYNPILKSCMKNHSYFEFSSKMPGKCGCNVSFGYLHQGKIDKVFTLSEETNCA